MVTIITLYIKSLRVCSLQFLSSVGSVSENIGWCCEIVGSVSESDGWCCKFVGSVSGPPFPNCDSNSRGLVCGGYRSHGICLRIRIPPRDLTLWDLYQWDLYPSFFKTIVGSISCGICIRPNPLWDLYPVGSISYYLKANGFREHPASVRM